MPADTPAPGPDLAQITRVFGRIGILSSADPPHKSH